MTFFCEALEKNNLAEKNYWIRISFKLCFWLRVVSRFLPVRIAGVANIMAPASRIMTTIKEQTRMAYP